MDEAMVVVLARTLMDVGEAAGTLPPEAAVAAVLEAAEPFELDVVERALLGHAARATMAPRTLRARHLDPLRAAGLDDRAIHDAVHVEGCFAYMNRLADSLGVTVVGAERRAWAVTLLGESALERHDGWAAGR
jgi:alkylhydroperoxidase family enzyme